MLENIKINLLNENNLSKYACFDKDAIRINSEFLDNDIRPNYYHDTDRIIHALSFTRYLGKTQVFSFKKNDHLTKRIVHVLLVSKISRTIGRALNLNEDLIEAIALGHDIGHTPLGHAGESILNKITLKELGTMFNHNIEGVRNYLTLEKINLTIQTLDGIMCHNGEVLTNIYEPKKKTKEEFLKEYELSYKDKDVLKKLRPMTLEGCVVRISDVIAYIGRDIEDSINLGLIKRSDIPKEIIDVLGSTNKEIVNTIILDIIKNSLGKPYLKLSDEVFKAMFLLKEFNYKNIYSKALTKDELTYYEDGMFNLFYKLLNDLNKDNKDSIIYKDFLINMDKEYLDNNSNKQKVIDYIAGMTDEYFKNLINNE